MTDEQRQAELDDGTPAGRAAELEVRVRAWSPIGDRDAEVAGHVCLAVVAFVDDTRAVRLAGWTERSWLGATMLAARLIRRRNSPAGIDAFTEAGVAYVQRTDPDVASLLRLKLPSIG